MAILTAKKSWRRPTPPSADRGAVLTDEERRHVATALAFLKRRHGSWLDLAKLLTMKEETLAHAVASPRRIGPGIALRVAALVAVPAGDLLAGRWPEAGSCPLCGAKATVSAAVAGP